MPSKQPSFPLATTHHHFGVYGDNIVECERMLHLLQEALGVEKRQVTGSLPAPAIVLTKGQEVFVFQCFPAFGRWESDVQRTLRERGAVLREAADVVLTRWNESHEIPLLAVEFCSALPAGNQAWQRSGRAYSIPKACIPYIFVTELGGFELDRNRERKAARLPNPAVPYSFVSYSSYTGYPVMIAYLMNPGADEEAKTRFADAIAGHALLHLDYGKAFLV